MIDNRKFISQAFENYQTLHTKFRYKKPIELLPYKGKFAQANIDALSSLLSLSEYLRIAYLNV